ncbi:MAG: ChaB family protein [Thermoleophilia bacterium]
MPSEQAMPDTLRRSGTRAQRTWIEARDSAIAQYGDDERAFRTAWAALKYTHERVGDRWVPKDHPGPSDPQAALSGAAARRGDHPTAGGVDQLGHTRDELLHRARELEIRGRSRMNKGELARAIARKQARS